MHPRSLTSLIPSALFAAIGCGGDAAPTSRASTPTGAITGASCGVQNQTQACTCSTGWPGRQTCSANAWSSCTCRAPSGPSGSAGAGGSVTTPVLAGLGSVGPDANRSPTRFDWERTQPSMGSCEAGHYEGTFTGIYGPSIIVVSDLKVVPVFPIDLPGAPGLQFDLTREGSGEVFTVQNGKMNGNALGLFPFTADIVGSLNCEQLTFDAMLMNGSYFIGPLEYKFEGPFTATYDKQTHSFVMGLWKVTEPAYPSAGGMGDWSATWKHN